MKKFLLVTAAVFALVAALAFSASSVVYAQSPDTDDTVCPYCGSNGTGVMGGGRGFRGQLADGEEGPLHAYLFPALAEAFGLTQDQLQAAHDEGKTLWVIAQEQGKSVEQFQALMTDARSKAFTQAVAAGVISQEQADWMLERTNGARGAGYGAGMMGAGNCTGIGGGRVGGGRWSNQP